MYGKDDFYKTLFRDEVINAIIDELPNKIQVFMPYGEDQPTICIADEDAMIKSGLIKQEYFEKTIFTHQNPETIKMHERRKEVVASFRKSDGDDYTKTSAIIKKTREYLKMLENGDSDLFLYSTLDGNISGMFLWNHHYASPLFCVPSGNNSSFGKIEGYPQFDFPTLQLDKIKPHQNYSTRSRGTIKDNDYNKIVLTTTTKKGVGGSEMSYTTLTPKMNFSFPPYDIKSLVYHYSRKKELEIFYTHFNLTMFYIKKFILKLKRLKQQQQQQDDEGKKNNSSKQSPEELMNSQLGDQISKKLDPLMLELISGDSNKIYAKTCELLYRKAKFHIDQCIKMCSNNTFVKDVLSITFDEKYKPIINVTFLNGIKNVVIVFFGQILMFIKVFLKMRGEKPASGPSVNIPYLLSSILAYIKKDLIETKKIKTLFVPLFGSNEHVTNVIMSIDQMYQSYLSFSEFYIGKIESNRFDTNYSESIFHLEIAQSYLSGINTTTTTTTTATDSKQEFLNFLFYNGYGKKNDTKLESSSLAVFIHLISVLLSKIKMLNNDVYRQVSIPLTKGESEARRKPVIDNISAYKFEKFMVDNNNSVTATSISNEKSATFDKIKFTNDIKALIILHQVPSEFLSSFRLSDFV